MFYDFFFLPLVLEIGIVDPKVILELFSMYQELQEKQAQNINKRQVRFAYSNKKLLIVFDKVLLKGNL